MLDEAGHSDCKIFASSDIDEYTIMALKEQGAKIDIYGVGTKMITSNNTPSLGGVYKISNISVNGSNFPKMKVSDNLIKMTNPGVKTVVRLFEKATNKAIADVICLADEVIDGNSPLVLTHPEERYKSMEVTDFYTKNLYKDIYNGGKLVYNFPTALETRAATAANLDGFWSEYLRLTRPHQYKVDLSDKLYELKQQLIRQGRSL
jgi:nicotinate phosphoribosyltransferase